MALSQKSDFDLALARFEAWWHGEIIDRPVLTVYLKREGIPERFAVSRHASLKDRWMDPEYGIESIETFLDGEVFAAEAFPTHMPNLGPDICATLFGSELEFGEDTTWAKPVVQSCRDILKLKPNFNNVYWKKIREMTRLSLERGNGRWVTGITDLHTNGDLLAALRGPESLCLELADDPEGVRLACEYVTSFFPAIYEDLYGLIANQGQPATTWLRFLHSGRAYVTSCDFICMISPETLETAILPSIVKEMEYLDCSIFHLDGPGALRHLDRLLEIPQLNGIQWVFGHGNGPATKWIDVYKKVQAAGKSLEIPVDTIENAKKIAEQIRPEGVWFWLNGGRVAREEVGDFIRWLEKWSAGKRV